MMRPTLRTITVTGLLAIGGLRGMTAPVEAASGGEATSGRVRVLKAPDGGIQPQAAIDAKGTVHLVYFRGEPGRRMWVARSTDDGANFAAEEPAFEKETGACACCGTRALADRRGRLYVLYRAATENVGRDMYLLISRDRGARFEGIMAHRW